MFLPTARLMSVENSPVSLGPPDSIGSMARRRSQRQGLRTKRRPAGESELQDVPAENEPADQDSRGERLQKVLAAAGVGSRRNCEEMILSGRVEVDGRTVVELGTRVDPHQQRIRVDGTPLPQPRLVYFAVHKPPGVLSTNWDPSGRPRVIDLIPPGDERVYTVGRLDKSSEGLILVTNDGELANRLTHPRYGIEKTYQVVVAGTMTHDESARLRKGVHLAEGLAKVARLTVKSARTQSTLLEIVLKEGRNREIRRILAREGHKVLRLKRIAIGELKLEDLPPGEFRPLRADEVRRLRHGARRTRGRGRPRTGRSSGGPKRPSTGKPQPSRSQPKKVKWKARGK